MKKEKKIENRLLLSNISSYNVKHSELLIGTFKQN